MTAKGFLDVLIAPSCVCSLQMHDLFSFPLDPHFDDVPVGISCQSSSWASQRTGEDDNPFFCGWRLSVIL